MILARLLLVGFLLLAIGASSPVEVKQCGGEQGEGQQCINPDAEAATSDGKADAESNDDPTCPSRSSVIRCAGEYLDTNQNGLLERSELQAAIDSLPWLKRGILSILGSVDKMMKRCDTDGDDAISIDYDMKHNTETCLATCFKRRAFKNSFFPDCN